MRALVYLDDKYIVNVNKSLPSTMKASSYISRSHIFTITVNEPIEKKEQVRQQLVEFFESIGLNITLRIFKV